MSEPKYDFNSLISNLYSDNLFDEVILLYESNRESLYLDAVSCTIIAAAYFQCGQNDAATKFYAKALDLDASSFDARNNLAVILLEQENFENAEHIFKDLIAEFPERLEPYVNLANLYYKQQKFNEALEFYKLALSHDLSQTNIIFRISEIFSLSSEYDQSVKYLNTIEQSNPEYFAARFAIGECFFKKRDYEQARKYFFDCVNLKPDDALSFQNIGTCFFREGMKEKSLEMYNRALKIDDSNPELFYNIGLVYFEDKNSSDALEMICSALDINENYVDAKALLIEVLISDNSINGEIYFDYLLEYVPEDVERSMDLSSMYLKAGFFERAIELNRSILLKYPNDPQKLFLLAHAYDLSQRYDDAFDVYQKAIDIDPTMSGALYNMAIISSRRYDYVAAEGFYLQAICSDPNYEAAHNNLALIYQRFSDHSKAVEHLEKVISINEENHGAKYNLSGSLVALGKHNEAKEVLLELLGKSNGPDDGAIHNSLGTIFQLQGNRLQAIEHFENALAVNSDIPEAAYNLVYNLANVCAWEKLRNYEKLILELGISKGVFSPFALWQFQDDPQVQLKRAIAYTNKKYRFENLQEYVFQASKSKKIKIGFFSADFRQHPVSFLSIRLLELIDRDLFTVIGYCTGPEAPSSMRTAIINAFDKFYSVRDLTDAEIVALSRKDTLDIAIDLTGYTDNDRAGPFVNRIAPIQINFLGYPGTTGSNFMDYIICDKHVIPQKYSDFYTESKIYMPDVYMPTDNTRPRGGENMLRKDFGLPEDAIVLCCFNNNYKISSEEFQCWCEILQRNEKTVLWLKASNSESQASMKSEIKKFDIDVERLIFAGYVEREEDHLARQSLADLFLDTFNFNAHTTATEALWAGVPIVTKSGKSFAARVSGSLLTAVGLEELVTFSKKEYIQKIEELAQDPIKLKQLKVRLKKNLLTFPLFNSEQYAKNFEKAMVKAVENYEKKIKKDIIIY